MSPRPDTWMPMYWGDYTRDTGNLSATCHGAYLMLIKHYWCSGSPLENDDDDLWRIACCDGKDDWLRIRPKLLRFFYIDGNLLRHKRIDAELAKARARVESRAEAGRVGANRRWGNNSKAAANASDSHASANGKPIADPLPVPLGEPSDSQWQNDGKSQSHYPSKEEIPHSPPLRSEPTAKPNPRGSRLPSDWQPTDVERQYASDLGLDPDRVAADFRDYWTAKAGANARKVDWTATWQTWCRRAADERQRLGRPPPQPEFRNGAFALALRLQREESLPQASDFQGKTVEGELL